MVANVAYDLNVEITSMGSSLFCNCV